MPGRNARRLPWATRVSTDRTCGCQQVVSHGRKYIYPMPLGLTSVYEFSLQLIGKAVQETVRVCWFAFCRLMRYDFHVVCPFLLPDCGSVMSPCLTRLGSFVLFTHEVMSPPLWSLPTARANSRSLFPHLLPRANRLRPKPNNCPFSPTSNRYAG